MTDSTTVRFGDKRFACGLTWLVGSGQRGRLTRMVRQARSLGASWYAEREGQTGFWVGEEPDRSGGPLTSLADLVAQVVDVEGEAPWQALFECDESRFLIVRGRGKSILPDGDEVIESLEEALEAFDALDGWEVVYASPGLVQGARELPFEFAGVGAALVPVPLARGGRSRRRLVVGAVAAVLVAGVVGVGRWAWETYKDVTTEIVVSKPKLVDKTIIEGVDAEVFLAGCIAAKREPPVLPPMWELVNIECVANTKSRQEISGVLEEGALFVRWRMKSGANGSLARRVAERRLSEWDLGAVLAGTAWGAMGVSAPVRSWDGDEPSTVAFRGAVDRALGTIGILSYAERTKGFEVVIRTMYPLSTVRERISGIAWLDFVAASWTGDEWRVVGRRVRPRTIKVWVEEES